jgi:small subunit ribosomal protein S7e
MSSKILKPAGSVPDELELQVAQNMLDLENSVPELKADLRVLQISSAKQVR